MTWPGRLVLGCRQEQLLILEPLPNTWEGILANEFFQGDSGNLVGFSASKWHPIISKRWSSEMIKYSVNERSPKSLLSYSDSAFGLCTWCCISFYSRSPGAMWHSSMHALGSCFWFWVIWSSIYLLWRWAGRKTSHTVNLAASLNSRFEFSWDRIRTNRPNGNPQVGSFLKGES